MSCVNFKITVHVQFRRREKRKSKNENWLFITNNEKIFIIYFIVLKQCDLLLFKLLFFRDLNLEDFKQIVEKA